MASIAGRGADRSGRPDALARAAFISAAVLTLFLAAITVEMFFMLLEMRQLGSSVPSSAPSVNRLGAIQADLDRMQPDLHQVDARLNQIQGNTSNLDPSLRDLASKVAALDADLVQIKADLRDIDQHVASLDRKTGPSPPALP